MGWNIRTLSPYSIPLFGVDGGRSFVLTHLDVASIGMVLDQHCQRR